MASAAEFPGRLAGLAFRLYVPLRLGAGALLLYAGTAKVFEPLAFYQAVLHYRLLPGGASAFVSAVLPWVEVVLGAALLLNLCATGAWLAASLLFGAFSAARALVVLQGTAVSCGCLPIQEGVSSWPGVGLAAALAALAAVGLACAVAQHRRLVRAL